MKKILLLFALIFAFASCTLEEDLRSKSTPETYYQTTPQILTGLNGCYAPLRSIYSSMNYFQLCEAASDLINHSTNLRDAQCDISQSYPRYGSTLWTSCYKGVMRCNAMYAAIERAPLTQSEKAPLFAECVILRAYYYYILTINFNNVPYYWDEVTDANNDIISSLPRMSAVELRNELYDQLWYWLADEEGCQKALPYNKTYVPENDYRIGSMVGFVLAGKMAMWNHQWNKAIKCFQYIEDVYGCLEDGAYTPINSLLGYPLTDIMFRNRYTEESIWELPAYAKEYGLRVHGTLASRCMPPRSTIGGDDTEEEEEEILDDETAQEVSSISDYYNGIVIPELGKQAYTSKAYRPTNYFIKNLMPYTGAKTDKRTSVYDTTQISGTSKDTTPREIEGSAGYLAWCYSGWLKDEDQTPENRKLHFFNGVGKASAKPYLGDKFWCPGMVYNHDTNNLKIFRFATVVLDLAECWMEMGDWEKANGYLNATRRRAGLEPVSFTGDEHGFLNALYEESGRELFGEFSRRHNLVRWGVFYDRITNYADTSYLKNNVKEGPCREFYPIPLEQIELSHYNLDNNEYAKYGL